MSIPKDARLILPGVYDTPDGTMHIDLEQFLAAAGGNPRSERDRATAMRAIARVLAREGIEIPLDVQIKDA
jgi:hypothetical protein